MNSTITMLIGAVALGAAAPALAQRSSAPAFEASGTSCSDVRWSQESLRQYPNIASACQEVLERDGRYYVLFEGEVQRVANRGQEITVSFRGGDRLTLTPPENFSLTLNGRRTQARDLRPGDDLRFYVPEGQLAASFYADQPLESPAEVVPIGPPPPAGELLAQNQQPRSTLPRTASAWPLAGLFGALLAGLGGLLTVLRRSQRPT